MALTGGSVQTGIKGEYSLPVGSVFREAWENVNGIKKYFVVGQIYVLVVLCVLSLLVVFFFMLFKNHMPANMAEVLNLIMEIVFIDLTLCAIAYLNRISIRHLAGFDVDETGLFKHFKQFKRMIVFSAGYTIFTLIVSVLFGFFAFFLFSLAYRGSTDFAWLCYLGSVVLVVAGYLILSFATTLANLTLPIAMDREISVIKSFQIFFLTLIRHWVSVLWINFLCIVILALSCIPFGIPLIWTVPWVFNTNAVILRRSIGLKTTQDAVK